MHCPESVIAWRNAWVYIVRHDGADYKRGVPWRERINLLRYEVQIKKPFHRTFNEGGKAHLWLANLIWRLKGNAPFPRGGAK